MTTLDLPLSERMQRFVEEQAEMGGYQSPADYLRALIRQAQVKAEKRWLDEQLREGLESPVSEMTEEDWASLRQEIIDRSPELRDVESP
jgi:putative addiction module CopG family antidote